MYLGPGEQLWLDAWIPRDDPLWMVDVSAAAEWVGAWWTEALAGFGQRGFEVHRGRPLPGALGDLVCFAGRGPGEVFHGGTQGGRALAVAGAGGGPVLVVRVPALGSGAVAGARDTSTRRRAPGLARWPGAGGRPAWPASIRRRAILHPSATALLESFPDFG